MQSNIWKSYIAKNIVLKTPSKLFYILRKHIKEYSSNKIGMPKLKDLLKPNPSVQGMLVLDKAKFNKIVTIPYINVSQSKLSDILPHLKKYLIKLPKLKPIQVVNDQTRVYLNPEVISAWDDIASTDKESLNKFDVTEGDFNFCNQTLTYDNYMVDEMLKAILPDHQEGTSSFTKVGHIIHLNLREHLLPYKNIIAQILYDKVPHCETVVNKVHMIDNTYRNFQMEVLCGKDDLKTKVKQNSCLFEFDFGTVYWNSRLSTEHERIIKLIKEDDVLFDVFAGVGPFSVPAAKKKCVVYANDLNPESYNWLKHNSKLNKVNDQYLSIFNKDGKDFILNDIKSNLVKHIDQNIHIVMNLPALAMTFLKYFIGLYAENEIPSFKKPPTVYVYCFAKGEDYTTITEDLISSNLNRNMKDNIEMFRVRTVSSFKEMMRVKFNLTEDILVKKCKRPCEESADNSKRQIAMGKNKHQKIKNIFKVAGAKSLKPKSKAKIVKGQLKQITLKNKSKISEIDEQLVCIQDNVRQNNKNVQPTNNNANTVTTIKPTTEEDYEKMEIKTDTTLISLNNMQLCVGKNDS